MRCLDGHGGRARLHAHGRRGRLDADGRGARLHTHRRGSCLHAHLRYRRVHADGRCRCADAHGRDTRFDAHARGTRLHTDRGRAHLNAHSRDARRLHADNRRGRSQRCRRQRGRLDRHGDGCGGARHARFHRGRDGGRGARDEPSGRPRLRGIQREQQRRHSPCSRRSDASLSQRFPLCRRLWLGSSYPFGRAVIHGNAIRVPYAPRSVTFALGLLAGFVGLTLPTHHSFVTGVLAAAAAVAPAGLVETWYKRRQRREEEQLFVLPDAPPIATTIRGR